MQLSYKVLKQHHRLLFTLLEMRDLEELVTREAADAAERIDLPHAR